MNKAKSILNAGLLSTGVLAAGCAVDAGKEPAPSATTAQLGQPIVSYDPATKTYRFETGTLDPARFPWFVEINHEVRGTFQTRDDVVKVEGVAAGAEISFISASAGTQGDPPKQLAPGESADLNACGWVNASLNTCQYFICVPTSQYTIECFTVLASCWNQLWVCS